jgi:hypothetical protein
LKQNLKKSEHVNNQLNSLKLGELKKGLFRVMWVIFKVKKTNREVVLGVCGYCWKPAFIGTFLHSLIVNDLYIDEDTKQCEEEERCLNLSCPFNKTTPETYALSKDISEKFLKAFLKPKWTKYAGIVASYAPFAEEARRVYIEDKKTSVIEIGE